MKLQHLKLRKESGYATVMVALSLMMLMAFVGLATDSAMLFRSKRNLQIAADAAAQAGALDYIYNWSPSSAKTAAASMATTNGYTDGVNGAHVTINSPALYGASKGVTGSVEAIVARDVPMTIMSVFGFKTMSVHARAVGASPGPGTACIWLTNATASDLQVQGNYNIVASNCGIYDNSSASNSVAVTGNGGTLNALYLNTVGGASGTTKPTPVTTGVAPRTNPWGIIAGPTPKVTISGGSTTVSWTGCDYIDSTTTTLSGTFTTPGTKMAGAGKVMCFSNPVTLNNATFGACSGGCTTPGGETITTPAGTLAFAQGVTISGNVAVYGGTVDVAAGTFNQGNANLTVVAPTSGTYNAIGLMQPKSNTNQLQVQFGSGNQSLDAYIYAPGAQVYLQDHGGGITVEGIVADTLFDKASTLNVTSYDKLHASTTPDRVIALVE